MFCKGVGACGGGVVYMCVVLNEYVKCSCNNWALYCGYICIRKSFKIEQSFNIRVKPWKIEKPKRTHIQVKISFKFRSR